MSSQLIQQKTSSHCASVREALKVATSGAHARLHRHPFFRPFAAGAVDRPTYGRVLSRLFGFHAPLEIELESAAQRLDLGDVMAGRGRTQALTADLGELGFTQPEVANLPRLPWPEIQDTGRFFGTLYVREGSTLGGRVLAQSLLPGERGRRFLSGQGCDRGLWAALLAKLQVAADQGHTETILAGAQETFAAMEKWLNDCEQI